MGRTMLLCPTSSRRRITYSKPVGVS